MATKLRQLWSTASHDGNKPPGKTSLVLRGAPDDRGVLNVGGRVGAAGGPAAFRRALGNMMTGLSAELEGRVRLDAGSDIPLGPSIEKAHADAAAALAGDLASGAIPVLIGGGHDYGYPLAMAMARTFGPKKCALINVDAHLDLRPLSSGRVTSGSPFFLALEDGSLNGANFFELGIQQHCNAADRMAYAKAKKATVITLAEWRAEGIAKVFRRILASLEKKGLNTALSIDLDAVAGAHAPGVSAPQADGLSPGDLFEILEIAARSKVVVALGFFELAPALDTGDATARLAATALHRYACALTTKRR